jgi:hypothetical protein
MWINKLLLSCGEEPFFEDINGNIIYFTVVTVMPKRTQLIE